MTTTGTPHGSLIMNGDQKLNQFGDYADVTHMTTDDWEYRWSLQQTKFHMPIVHPMLQKHIQKLTSGRKRQRVFVPLCGKSLDLKWLLDQGHEVIGNDCVDAACTEFFAEHSIPYTTEKLTGVDGLLYKATDGKSIKLYRCDCLALSSNVCGKFDCIWDRGGFVALSLKERKRYANVIRSLMKPDCRYLLDCFLLDNDVYGGPPFDCSAKDVSMCFDEHCSIEKIDTADAFTQWQESWGLKTFVEEVYMLQLYKDS